MTSTVQVPPDGVTVQEREAGPVSQTLTTPSPGSVPARPEKDGVASDSTLMSSGASSVTAGGVASEANRNTGGST